MMFKKLSRVIFRTIIHENTHNEVNIQIDQYLHGVELRLLRMLPEPPGKSDIFSGRVFPRYQTALHSHLQKNGA